MLMYAGKCALQARSALRRSEAEEPPAKKRCKAKATAAKSKAKGKKATEAEASAVPTPGEATEDAEPAPREAADEDEEPAPREAANDEDKEPAPESAEVVPPSQEDPPSPCGKQKQPKLTIEEAWAIQAWSAHLYL